MSERPAWADEIEVSLELLAERAGDPAPLVYRRLFATHPQMEAYFWRDTDGSIKGEMLARTFTLIFDFIRDRRFAAQMVANEAVTHEGYEIPKDVFAAFFGILADAVAEALGPDFSPGMGLAWRRLVAELDACVPTRRDERTPNPYFKALREDFERRFLEAR